MNELAMYLGYALICGAGALLLFGSVFLVTTFLLRLWYMRDDFEGLRRDIADLRAEVRAEVRDGRTYSQATVNPFYGSVASAAYVSRDTVNETFAGPKKKSRKRAA